MYDTGQSGDVLLHNARLAGASLRGLDCIVLSRGHYDHSGGLQKVPEMNKGVRLALHPAAFEKKFARDQNMIKDIGLPPGLDYLEMNCSMAIQPGPSDLGSGISTTGEIERIMPYETPESNLLVEKEGLLVADQVCDDQSLILRVENKIILLCGRCKL